MSMAWSEDLAIGVAQIDQQHRELFRRFDDLLEAIRKTDRALAATWSES